jgi:hypothetical protein
MSLDGSGVYYLLATAFPAVQGAQIKSALYNALMTDLASALNTAFYRDGQALATGDFNMNNHKIVGLANGSNTQDAVTYGQLQTAISGLSNATLTALGALTPAADKVPYFTNGTTAALFTIVAAIRALLSSADLATFRSNLGLGDSAVKNTGTAAGTVAAGDHTHAQGSTSVVGPLSLASHAEAAAGTDTAKAMTADDVAYAMGLLGFWKSAPSTGAGTNCNTLITEGNYFVPTASQSNGPGFGDLFMLVNVQGANVAQFAIGLTGAIAFRKSTDTGNTWNSWVYPVDPTAVTAYSAQHYASVATISSSAGALAVDCNVPFASNTLTANTTVSAATNQARGKVVELEIVGASSYTLSWNANWKATDIVALPSAPAAGKRLWVLAESDGTSMYLRSAVKEA